MNLLKIIVLLVLYCFLIYKLYINSIYTE